ncbi:hypothetical protein EDEG_02222 [Edhazardia aedis USNM 41457]|uniref:Proteasome subunit beta n=1 Tax=Edhazardia aedis (strain USNM 41457) TaxID=1003232 RepID=J9DQ24_EDHAE|nr:hypothetical protein EDEG_02222 [Edhazardia aedis USNM 41457]|eukprot:EJW03457.1 hypothetical protein EDEG_02222 [Edhazardia aedis USNM 41457]
MKIDSITKSDFSIRKLRLPREHISTLNFEKGTTTLAFTFKDGMIIAVDSRATAGSYIASQSIQKVIEINSHLLGTMAGGAADCQYWEKVMGIHCKRYMLQENKRISAAHASRYLSNLIYNYKGYGLSMGTMVCGFDYCGTKTVPAIYYVDNDGRRVKGDLFSVGSGSTIAYGILQDHRFDMEKK